MRRADLGELLRGDAPVVAVSVTDADPGKTAAALWAADVDVAELRIDRFGRRDPASVVAVARAFGTLPTIATIRSVAEGGGWADDDETRAALFAAVLGVVDGVDVELSSKGILRRVVDGAREAGRTVIVSHHDFEATPSIGELDALAEQAKENGADYVKVATMPRSQRDVRTLAEFTMRNADIGLITVAMGEYGATSRVFFPVLGSRLTFAHLGHASAPGQLPVAELSPLLRRFYPGYRGDGGPAGS
jgi:3-dehydroquinate dehydratase I